MPYRKLTQEQLLAELRAAYGDDPMQWAFQCPTCGKVITGQAMSDALKTHPCFSSSGERVITSDVLGQECLGRTDAAQGCDWAAYGLFRGPWEVTLDGKTSMWCFPIAERGAGAGAGEECGDTPAEAEG